MVGRIIIKSMLLYWRNLYYFQMLMYSGLSERFKTNLTKHLFHLGRFPMYRLIIVWILLPSKATRGPLKLLRQCYYNYEGVGNNSNVYPDQGLNYQILFQSHTMLRLWGVAGSEVWNWPCSLCILSPTLLPCRQAMKRVLHYKWVCKVCFAMEFCQDCCYI